MVQLHKISLLLIVAAVLFAGTTIKAESTGLNPEGDFKPGESHEQSSIYPVSKPDLVGIHRLARNAVDLIRIPPVPNVKRNSDEDSTNPGLLIEIPLRSAVSTYIHFSGTIHQSLSIRELLFPFHHFL